MYKIISYREYCKAMNEEYTEPAPSWFDRAQTQAIKTIRSEIVDVKIFPRNSAMLHQLRPEWKEKVITGIAEQIYYTHNQQYFIENGVFANRSYNQTQYGEGPVNQLAFENAIKKVCNPCKTAFIPTDWFYKRWNVKFDPKKYYIKYDPIIKDVNWGQIGGWLDDQLDLVEYLTTKYTSQEDFLMFRHDVNEAIENGEKAITELDERVTYLEDHKVVANPSGTFQDVLNSIIIDGVVYGIGGGTFDPSRYYTKQQTEDLLNESKLEIYAEMDDQIDTERQARMDADAGMVTLANAQTITGRKTFADGGLRVGTTAYNKNTIQLNNSEFTLTFPNASGTIALEGQSGGLSPEDILAGSNINIERTADTVTISATNVGSLFALVSNWISPMPSNPSEYDFDTQIKNYIETKGITKTPVNNDYVIVTYPSNESEEPYCDRCVYSNGDWIWEYRFVGDITGLQEQIDDLETNKADKTELPTKTSDLTNDSGFITSSYHDDTKEDTTNKITLITESATDIQYASAKATKDYVDSKQVLPDIPDVTKNYTLKALAGVVQWVEDETDPEQEFTTCDWEDIIEHCNKLEDGTITDTQFCEHYGKGSLDDFIGLERTLTINNGQDYKVRVIGIKHDTLATSGRAALTFQFTNFLCDSNGYSLAALWHDTSDTSTANFDFLNSTMRANLTGEGSGTIAWYEKGATTKSETYRSSVLDMLPAEIKSGLKSVVKKIGIGSASTGTHMVEIEGKQVEVPNATYTVQDYNTKVFLLSHSEITSASSEYALQEGAQYAYWQTHDTDADRIMQQLKGSDGALTTYTEITDPLYGSGYSYAGFNSSTAGQGGRQWLRSPYTSNTYGAWGVSYAGELYDYGYVYSLACAVAPCFCI